jgi:hypothetical protein
MTPALQANSSMEKMMRMWQQQQEFQMQQTMMEAMEWTIVI